MTDQPDREKSSKTLSDEAIAVFAFAAYHQLESGKQVSRVVIEDGAGHQADGKAVAELKDHGLADTENNRIVFTSEGEAVLSRVIGAIRDAGRASAT